MPSSHYWSKSLRGNNHEYGPSHDIGQSPDLIPSSSHQSRDGTDPYMRPIGCSKDAPVQVPKLVRISHRRPLCIDNHLLAVMRRPSASPSFAHDWAQPKPSSTFGHAMNRKLEFTYLCASPAARPRSSLSVRVKCRHKRNNSTICGFFFEEAENGTVATSAQSPSEVRCEDF